MKTTGRSTRRTTKRPATTHTTAATTHTTAATTSSPCGGISEQHNSYLNDKADIVREKCREFHACTVELYKSENLHRILAGDNIQLRNICGLLYQNTNGSYRILDNQCLTPARESIKELLGNEELSPQLEESIPRESAWGKLKTCLDDTPGDSTYLDKLCRLKGNSTAPLCNSTDVQTTTETFFNTKLRQYHCTCNTFTDSQATSLPLRPLIGGVCSGSLILLLIVIIVVLCVRQRKLRRRLYVLPCNISGCVAKPPLVFVLLLSSNHFVLSNDEYPKSVEGGKQVEVFTHQVPVLSSVATFNSFQNRIKTNVSSPEHTKFSQKIK